MKIPADLRRFATPAAWFATAAITFGLGRLSVPDEAGKRARELAQVKAAGSALDGDAASREAEETAARVRASQLAGSPTEALKELTNGRSLEDWLKHLMAQEDDVARMSGFMRMLELLSSSEDFEKAVSTLLSTGNGWARGREYSMLL